MSDLLDCNNCGKCCIKYSDGGLGSINREEFERLPDYAKQVARNGYLMENVIDIWIDSDGGEYASCPWIFSLNGKHYCSVYEYRPNVCRNYPVDHQQMVDDKCEMLAVYVTFPEKPS